MRDTKLTVSHDHAKRRQARLFIGRCSIDIRGPFHQKFNNIDVTLLYSFVERRVAIIRCSPDIGVLIHKKTIKSRSCESYDTTHPPFFAFHGNRMK